MKTANRARWREATSELPRASLPSLRHPNLDQHEAMRSEEKYGRCICDTRDTCREIVRKRLRVLAPGGCVIVIEFLAEPGKPESTFSWLFSVMIHGTRGGRSFSSAEIAQMLTACGASRTEVGGGLPVGFVVGYGKGGE